MGTFVDLFGCEIVILIGYFTILYDVTVNNCPQTLSFSTERNFLKQPNPPSLTVACPLSLTSEARGAGRTRSRYLLFSGLNLPPFVFGIFSSALFPVSSRASFHSPKRIQNILLHIKIDRCKQPALSRMIRDCAPFSSNELTLKTTF